MHFLSVPKEKTPKQQFNLDLEISRIMDEYGDCVLRTATMFLKDRHKAEDAFQEVFIRIYNQYSGFRQESSEKTWIIKIAVNVCKDMLKSPWFKKVILTDDLRSVDFDSDTESNYIKKDENKYLFDQVVALPLVFKEVILLYYYHNYNTIKIASILDIAEGTVRSRLHRARGLLKSKVGGRNDIDE